MEGRRIDGKSERIKNIELLRKKEGRRGEIRMRRDRVKGVIDDC